MTMLFRESLACGLQKCVGSLWKGNDYSDFNVIVEKISFKCHRFILSACSGFFKCLFQIPMKEQIEGSATLEGMTVSTFEIILNAVYTGMDGLSIDNVLDVWSASEMLQIGYLTEQCHTFVMENISVDTCFRFFDHATLYTAHTVVDHCLDFISRNFDTFRNKDRLLYLPVDQFYKVIANDNLATDREELVAEAVLNWVKYSPQSATSTSVHSGSNIEDTNDGEQSGGDASTNSLTNSGTQAKIHDDQAIESSDLTTDILTTRSQILETREIVDTHTVVPAQCNNVITDVTTDETEVENRKQHLAQLLSACRLFTVKSNFLDNIMKNNVRLLVDTGAYQLMHDALMYTMDISRRHDTWPDSALYRASSSFKHVVICLSNNKLVAYNLNTGNVTQFAELPKDCTLCSDITITVFDNILHLLFNKSVSGVQNGVSKCNKEVYMLTKEKTWEYVTCILDSRLITLLPQGKNIYYCHLFTNVLSPFFLNSKLDLYSFCCTYGHKLAWSKCIQLEDYGNCLVRFHKYVLVFCTKNNFITVECYNTETAKTHKCKTSMSGTSEDMVSFTNREDVYILQRNGTLWKVFSTDTTPVDFELVCQLWDFDCKLKGCVLYKKNLFIFSNSKETKTTLTALLGVFTSIKIIPTKSTTPCLPMTVS